jgi:hypothetical protein
MKINMFEVEDIVVIRPDFHIAGICPNWIGKIVFVYMEKLGFDYSIEFTNLHMIRSVYSCEIRAAEPHEEFLYYLHGSTALEAEAHDE